MSRFLDHLVGYGIYGRDVADIVDRIVCEWITTNRKRVSDRDNGLI